MLRHEWDNVSLERRCDVSFAPSAPTTLPSPPSKCRPRVGERRRLSELGPVSWGEGTRPQDCTQTANSPQSPSQWRISYKCFSLVLASLANEVIFSSKMNLFLPFCSVWWDFAFFLKSYPNSSWKRLMTQLTLSKMSESWEEISYMGGSRLWCFGVWTLALDAMS